ncbi:conserved hypothetical protein [Hahella chejuensis KCTC 2396]|uniref:Lipoprotein n=1 Tax=Hahella chejuensis (strain KCTC 2396) TaxID=349521 RepID=Q2SDK3_HAHCH|nr:hypothetical protein [Hahella chejuensis]ABC31271.1 conserved hypothetical protein [Hahella chejuensis KCTC 2396]
MNKFLITLLLAFTLSACDNDLYNELFRNPYMVDVAEGVKLDQEWKKFSPKSPLEIINQRQWVTIGFEGAEKWDFIKDGMESIGLVDQDDNPIKIDVKIITLDGREFRLAESSISSFIAFGIYSTKLPKDTEVSTIYIRSSRAIADANIGWLCTTGK